MKNNELQIGNVVVSKVSETFAMVIEEIDSCNGERIAKCVWLNKANEVVRDKFPTTALELEINRIFDTSDHIFEIDDYVVLKSGDYSMVIQGIEPKGELTQVTCSWMNTANELQVETFHSTSLIPE